MSKELVCKHCGKSLADARRYHQIHRCCRECHTKHILASRYGKKPHAEFYAKYELHKEGSLVYIVQSVLGGGIKIGASNSKNMRLRLYGLQTGNPVELRILAIAHCQPVDYEHDLHLKFHHLNLIMDWFMPVAEIWEYIESDPRWTIYHEIELQS